MVKKKFISIVATLGLVLAVCLMALPAMAAEEQPVTATVTVSEYMSITLADSGDAGIQFGSVAPGTTDNPDVAQNDTTPSVNITVELETNVDVNLTKWHTSNNTATATPLTTDYTNFATNVTPGSSIALWHWLTIPAGQPAGGYNSTFSYKAVKYT